MSFAFALDVLKAVRKKEPFKLNFAVSYLCNSRCVTCGIWKKYGRDKAEGPGPGDELTLEEIRKTFQGMPKTLVWIGFTGGEPFLRRDIAEIVAAAAQTLPRLSLISFPSNGLSERITLERLQDLARVENLPRTLVHFSLDGPPEIHDGIRGIPDAYEKTWSTYQAARKTFAGNSRFSFGIECTVSRSNVGRAAAFVSGLMTEGHSVSLNFARQGGFYDNLGDADPSPASDEKSLAEIVTGALSRFRKLRSENWVKRAYLEQVMNHLDDPRRMILPCSALESSLSLDPYGTVLPCLMWPRALGSVREAGFDIKAILASPAAGEARDLIKKEKCPICWTMCEASHTILTNAIRHPFRMIRGRGKEARIRES